MGEACKDALRLDVDRRLELEFHGTRVNSDAGLQFRYASLQPLSHASGGYRHR